MKSLTSTQLAAVSNLQSHAFYMLDVTIGTTSVHFTDCPKSFYYNGNSYAGAGSLLTFDAIEETFDISTNEISILLSGVDLNILALFRTEVSNLINRPIQIYRAPADTSFNLTAEPILIFNGFIMEASSKIELDPQEGEGAATISVSAANRFAYYGRTNLIRTNDTEHQASFPGDLGFQYVNSLATRKKQWAA